METIGSYIVPGAKLGMGYAERLLDGVTQDTCARFARPGGFEVRSNHPAFILGHLSLYPARVLQCLKLPAGPTSCPPHYESLFKAGVECQDDAQAKIYPPLQELRSLFFDSYQAAVDAVATAEDDAFGAPNPAEGRLRDLLPTVGAVISFYLIGHVQVHLGQFSSWRRGMGLPPA